MPDIVFDVTGRVLSGARLGGAIRAPGFELTSRFGMQARLRTPEFAINGQIAAGAVVNAEILVRGICQFSLSGEISQGNVLSAEMQAPGFRSVYGIAELEAPLFVVSGQIIQPVAIQYSTYAMNISNTAVTEYTNYPYDYIVTWRGQHYGCNATGLHLLEGLTDAGEEIEAHVITGDMDFQSTQLKRLPYVYIGSAQDDPGRLCVGANPDRSGFRTNSTTRRGLQRRAQLPRGPFGRYWSIRVDNIDGEPFHIDNIEPVPDELKRRI